ncbi:acyltransferase [Kribbella solani]|uniref:acyltransferase family protein n=1 Tax=Kribbella solani TaxID=236067 RepID=UPI0029A67ED2|nr:acyltransferase [Kribbella solani]MDX2969298.1 acyltransferase [Kribbella solani]MDX3001429.1 acyltransferase [Kribbella solani]
MRVLAVLAVMFTHTTYQGPFLHPELGPPLGRYPFQVGASVLLVISAYFVCVTIRRGSTSRWLWRRVCRVLPPYLAAVLFTYTLLVFFGPSNWILPTRHDLWGNLTLAASFDPTVQLIDGSYWTLPLQLMAFAVAALLWPRGLGNRITTLLWIMILAPVALQWNGRIDHSPIWVIQLWNGLGLHRMQLFAIGIAIWLWSKNRISAPHLGALLVATVFAQHAHTADWPSSLGIGALLLLVALAARGPDWTVFASIRRPIEFLARISFALYLLNQEVGYLIAYRLMELGAGRPAQIVGAVAGVIGLAWLLTKYVEEPMFRAFSGLRVRGLGARAFAWLNT